MRYKTTYILSDRGVDSDLSKRLKRVTSEDAKSVNQFVLDMQNLLIDTNIYAYAIKMGSRGPEVRGRLYPSAVPQDRNL